jgi:phenylalanyl-tRNA synthetase beta chain
VKVSYGWLQSMIPGLPSDPEALYTLLADRGAPVEDVVRRGEGLGDVVVGRVKSVRRHPDADRLSLCEVDNGEEVLQVVCGAPVIQEGGLYPFAGVGTVLPGGFKLKKAKIRGEYSNGMLCSEKELDLGRDQSGIMLLAGEELRPGQPLVEALGLDDFQIEIEVSPNRGDLLSHLGVAREIAPAGIQGVELPPIPGAPELSLERAKSDTEITGGGVTVRIEEPEMCPRFLGVVIRDIEVGPSPDWLARRLRSIGQQPINNVVDATNYVMMEMGNPLHAYDLDKLVGSEVVVRYASEGEGMETLDGVERSFTSEMMMVCDAEAPHDIAGIMGGEDSSVTEETTSLFLEGALWIPSNVRATRRALDISSDAAYRFERGVDPLSHEPAMLRAIQVILATAGGEVDGPLMELCPKPYEAIELTLRLGRVEQVLGRAFEAKEICDLLEPIGFACEERDGMLDVTVPSFRSYDVLREIDLIEEIARLYGYDAFGEALVPSRPSSVPDHPLFRIEDELRRVLSGLGLLEAANPSFAPEAEAEVELQNPMSMEESHLRATLLPGLARSVEYNWARGSRDVRLYEIGTVFRSAPAGEPPVEATRVGFLVTGAEHPVHWDRSRQPVDLWTLKGMSEALLRHGGRQGLTLSQGSDASGFFDAECSFSIRDEQGRELGRAGRVDPSRLDAPVWADEVWGFELELPADPEPRTEVEYEPLPAFPFVERDLALLLSEQVSASEVVASVHSAGGELLDDVTIFDVYSGDGVPSGLRSLAVRLRLQARDRTLRDKDADKVVKRVLQRLKEDLGVEQRI